MQRELSEASILTKVLMSSTDTIFYIKDSNSKYVIANEAFLNNISRDRDFKVFGLDDSNFFPADEAKKNYEQDITVLKTGKGIRGQEGIIPGNRKKKWGLISKVPILDALNKIVGVAGAFIDITSIKEQEKVNEYLKISLDEGPDAIFLKNRFQNKYWYISRAAEQLYEYPLKVFYNDSRFWINNCLHPDYRNLELKYQSDLTWPKIHRYRIITSKNEIKWIEERVISCQNFTLRIERDISSQVNSLENVLEKYKEETAYKLLNRNVGIDIISEAVGLPLKKIREIKNDRV